MHNNITFKIASLNDLSAIRKIGDRLFDHPIKNNRATEFLSDPRHHLILAYDDDEIVGMASGFHYVHPDKDPELFINEVAVLEEYRNMHIGRNLVEKICAHGKDLGCREVWVLTDDSNSAAIKAYLAAGGTENSEQIKMINFLLR